MNVGRTATGGGRRPRLNERMVSTASPRLGLATKAGTLAVAAALSLCACASATSTAGGTNTATSGSVPPASSPGTPGSTPAEQPSSNVTSQESVTQWVSQVCTAAKKLQAGTATPDLSKIQSDPQKAIKELTKQWEALPTKLQAIADEIEQIGAPDIPGGTEWTNTYVDGIRTLAAAFQAGVAKEQAAGGGLLGLRAFGEALDTAKVRAATAKIQAVDKKLQASQELKAAIAADPTCKSLEKG